MLVISFGDAYGSDEKVGGVLTTGVNFRYEPGCTQLDVSVYKAGRQDRLYTTPYLVVYDVSGREHGWFYWWYCDGDPMTYEVELMEAGGGATP